MCMYLKQQCSLLNILPPYNCMLLYFLLPPQIDLQFTSSDQPQTNPADTTGVAVSLLSGCESRLSSVHSQCQYLAPRGTYQHTANPSSMCCPLTRVYQHTATLTATVDPSWPDSCAYILSPCCQM